MSEYHLHQYDELKIERIYLGTGTTEPPRGVSAGTPASNTRITHMPTGIVAECGVHRSNMKNREVCRDMIEFALSILA